MGAMKELLYQAEEICENCFRAPKLCGKCVIHIFSKDSKNEPITVSLKGSNKEILKVEKSCSCGKSLTKTDLRKNESRCWVCRKKAVMVGAVR